jgi:1,2-phenylacetyl-CoA epoxidase PaaB subunit
VKAWIVRDEDRVVGRVLARDEEHALTLAKDFWPKRQKFTAKPVGEEEGCAPENES